ncbi:MAG: hypothetical protein JXR46_07895 [Calditrichaceae bacterium]|nr:hypothetical protein [Calditrichaceae bacterium]MBN2708950.1 hypothetical protein [Calditrichaceae bacterium]RQV97527.1 MAG: hypothetical protein EH224_00465 [Calditrichota bacterium]
MNKDVFSGGNLECLSLVGIYALGICPFWGYYFGARYYPERDDCRRDPEIARWHVVDPLTHKSPSLSPYVYCSNSPLNRFDRDGKEDWPTVIRSAGELSLAIIGFVGGVSGMITAIPEEVGSFGATTPWAIAQFWISYSGMMISGVMAAEATGNLIEAFKTPDGMTAKNYKIIKSFIGGLGGNRLTQEGTQLIYELTRLRGISRITEESLIFLLQRLWSVYASEEQLILFLQELEYYIEQENNNSSNDESNNEQNDQNEAEEEEEEEEILNPWYDPTIWRECDPSLY